MECDCYITFGNYLEIVIGIVRNVESKLFHDRYADDVSNSYVKPCVDIFAKDVLSKLALGDGNGHTGIERTTQVRVISAHIRQEALVSHLYEGGTTV